MNAIQSDIWHFSRRELAEQVLGLFEANLSSALTFFAPRRMGKTEFLKKDITPLAESKGYNVFYFSFLDADEHIAQRFSQALSEFVKNQSLWNRTKQLLKPNSISVELTGIKAEMDLAQATISNDILNNINKIAKLSNSTLLLLDEIQAIADKRNQTMVASLRTALDTNKDKVKVLFTGSSREGLRQMFSASSAPFFHFGQNLNFPNLTQPFIEHLSGVFAEITKRQLDSKALWNVFVELNHSPQFIRSLLERMILNPNLSLLDAKQYLLQDTLSHRDFSKEWENLRPLERFLLQQMAFSWQSNQDFEPYSMEFKQQAGKELALANLANSTIQSGIRSLSKKQLIYRNAKTYQVEDHLFLEWILDNA